MFTLQHDIKFVDPLGSKVDFLTLLFTFLGREGNLTNQLTVRRGEDDFYMWIQIFSSLKLIVPSHKSESPGEK